MSACPHSEDGYIFELSFLCSGGLHFHFSNFNVMESHTSNIKVKFQIFMSVSDSRIHGGKAVYYVLAFEII